MDLTPHRPADLALVLTGGGARAAYQVGVLAALAERRRDVEMPILTGASAGAINAAFLAARGGSLAEGIAELRGHWSRLTADLIYGPRGPGLVRSIARWLEELALGRQRDPLRARGFFDTRALRSFLGNNVRFERIAGNVRSGHLRAVALTATSYSSGRTVTFVEGAPEVSPWRRAHRVGILAPLGIDHLMASSAIPIVFPAVKLEDGYYGDGSVRQTFPLSPAIHLGARRILAIGTRPGHEARDVGRDYPSVAESLGLLLDSVFMDHLDADAEVLESINRLQADRPGGDPAGPFRPIDFLLFRPSRDLGEMARECADRLPRVLRPLARALGAHGRGGADFLSYLLFDPSYTGRLIELGHSDAVKKWAEVEPLLGPREGVALPALGT